MRPNILVAIDDVSESPHMLGYISKLAHALAAKLWLVHVVEPQPVPPVPVMGSQWGATPAVGRAEEQAWAEERRQAAEAVHHDLKDMADHLEEAGLDAECMMPVGDVVHTLLDKAHLLDAEMIVLTSHRPGLIDRLFAGSVEQAVLRQADCPVLVLPPQRKTETEESGE